MTVLNFKHIDESCLNCYQKERNTEERQNKVYGLFYLFIYKYIIYF